METLVADTLTYIDSVRYLEVPLKSKSFNLSEKIM